MEVVEEHFLGFSPRDSMAEVVPKCEGRSAGEIFSGLPEVKGELWVVRYIR